MSDPLKLRLHSEPFSASGNLAADGYRKLLGAPSISLLQTVVREAVQNSCDASLGDRPTEVLFRLRTLTPEQSSVLWDKVFASLPAGGDSGRELQGLRQSPVRVLEIADFGTGGLAGPTRADLAPDPGEPTDFINFLRNVGAARDTNQGGGTYGYGKTSLYLASRCSTIVVDSQTTFRGSSTRRLMAAQLSSAFKAKDDKGTQRRFTGRHWWGVPSPEGDHVDPLEGEAAVELSTQLGLPDRNRRSKGTTIMIVDPLLGEGSDQDVAQGLAEALLWFFWPRLLETTPAEKRLNFRLVIEDREMVLPAPEQTPPLDLFARAMNDLRDSPYAGETIRSQRPIADLGRLRIVSGMRGERLDGYAGEDSLFPVRSCHIAVMRPVELVVRYYKGHPLPDDLLEWAGVFVASSEPEVEAAFAASEPPAHDDWQPKFIEDRRPRTFVRVAVREIERHAAEYANPAQPARPSGDAGPSLAGVAGLLGRMLEGAVEEGAGPRAPTPGGRGTRRSNRISPPVFQRLMFGDEGLVAVFQSMLSSDGRFNILRVEPALSMEGGTTPPEAAGREVRVVATRLEGELLGRGERIEVGARSGMIEFEVQMPSDCAVTLGARLESAGAEA